SSQLIMAGEQLRFLSKYFLTKRYSLVHGAEIFAGYLENDLKFVEKVEEDKLARSLFTFQFAEKAIRKMFPKEAEHILTNFVEMIVFDALTGNNDRHFYNWGVIKHVENKKNAIFAPVYDSARGLFWNDSESKLLKLFEQPKQIDEKIKKYSEQSRPKIGWEGLEELNHFDLVDKIYSSDSRYREVCAKLITQDNLEKSLNLVNVSFSKFYSSNRIELIRKCLTYRFERLRNIVK
ncbi:MAG TPA: HipA domain-containing protein, partial [Bacteroidia bacterium]|nr:HipA domain-containing protein [Bacteroidia bacterium]